MYGVGAKIIAVSSSRLAGTLPALPPLLMVVMYGSLACYVSMGLPFYDNRMNRFRAGASTVTATMALGALILVLTGADAEIFTATWVVVGVLSTVFGSMLPVARRRQLLRLLMSIRPRMLEELAAREDDASFRQLRGQRRIATEEEPRRKSQWRRITASRPAAHRNRGGATTQITVAP